MASSKETYCLCGQPYNIGQFMIECDCCREWFHGSCVDVKIYHSDDIDKYHCPKCSQTYGPSVLKIPTNNHRADRYELGAENHPSQVGTPAWVRALAARPLRPSQAALMRLRPHQFTEEFIRDDGFNRPIIFHTPEGLDLKVPNPATFTVRSVLRFCGAQLEVEVIDVRKQSTLRMPLGDFVDYFETPPEHRDEKALNVLSLEFSDTNLAPLVEPPALARRLDWAARAVPGAAAERPRPAVQKYCLMSAAGSYTDFHLDFGGTTVWYHVLHGQKIFYLVPPTATNLALYQQWSAANNQNERFFGDMVEWYGTAELQAGQTLFIPSGWIHAVLTPCDSLVFGGNFLHSYAIEMQLQVYEIERRVETPTMFRYPLFEAMHWYAGAHLLTMLRRHNEETQDEDFTLSESVVQPTPVQIPPLLLRGIKLLANALKEWHALKSTDAAKRDNVPKCLNSGQLVRELCKELRTLEKRSLSAANKDKDYKVKNHSSPKKSHSNKQSASKKSLKLTLPKPIMHMGHNGEFTEEKVYADKFDVYNDGRFVSQDVKYTNGLTDKYVVDGKEMIAQEKFQFQNYGEQGYQDGNGYVERNDKKNVLKIKLNNSPSSSRDEPPPYNMPEHSILKSHLIRSDRPILKPIHQWTISKKDIGDYHEEQILFTNENLQANMRIEGQELNYGPGMYSAEDVQQDYQYSEAAKPGSYQPDYGYQPADVSYVDSYQRYEEAQMPQTVHQQTASFSNVAVPEINGGYHNQLPSYDAAIAQQYANNNYQVLEEQKPAATEAAASASAAPAPVRRSERPARRRVSATYDYEDGDLYIDDAPPPRRRKPPRHKHHHHQHQHQHSRHAAATTNSSSYRSTSGASGTCVSGASRAPANGIESLIQASVLAEEEPPTATEDAAVAGMLSISERYTAPQRTFGLAADSHQTNSTHDSGSTGGGRSRSRKAAASSADEDYADEEDVIKEVHRDEEYVYPSLEASSDDEDEWPARRRRTRLPQPARDKDESWSPRARLGRVAPRLRGPARAGVRRECVRAALTAAAHAHVAAHAAAAHAHPAAHAATHAHHHKDAHHQNAKRAVLATKSRRPPPPVQSTPNKNIRLKKGMKTAKQRLGKILKIHKMVY
ncbi:histone lysine demethylase PHF8-like isoform X2 [Galleria mellonella]|uniref:[histone H3]-dimethyl-L-lysine(36) demethylase n=1 Tax=Galleria mellonella TaxID=7137 RepID=A0ABM3MP33_GALME|nr:histone lysine demethylase PHF8-like isoform X2 [Galleria mellonella]